MESVFLHGRAGGLDLILRVGCEMGRKWVHLPIQLLTVAELFSLSLVGLLALLYTAYNFVKILLNTELILTNILKILIL